MQGRNGRGAPAREAKGQHLPKPESSAWKVREPCKVPEYKWVPLTHCAGLLKESGKHLEAPRSGGDYERREFPPASLKASLAAQHVKENSTRTSDRAVPTARNGNARAWGAEGIFADRSRTAQSNRRPPKKVRTIDLSWGRSCPVGPGRTTLLAELWCG